jgi:hypothetical protein
MTNLIEAVLSVMEDCVGLEKSMTVGSGKYAYKGVSDKDVKLKVGSSMRKHGLIILPTKITPVHTIDNWEETTPQYGTKRKQSVFTEVITEYKLMHKSGESIDVAGYGHGVDPQDKAAGKATTYALKYVLLYSFMVATGYIDDADSTHSDDIDAPKKQAPKATAPKTEKELEDLFKALVVKQKGMTDTLKGVVKRSTWDSDKMFKLIQESGNKTITKAQVDEANV